MIWREMATKSIISFFCIPLNQLHQQWPVNLETRLGNIRGCLKCWGPRINNNDPPLVKIIPRVPLTAFSATRPEADYPPVFLTEYLGSGVGRAAKDQDKNQTSHFSDGYAFAHTLCFSNIATVRSPSRFILLLNLKCACGYKFHNNRLRVRSTFSYASFLFP